MSSIRSFLPAVCASALFLAIIATAGCNQVGGTSGQSPSGGGPPGGGGPPTSAGAPEGTATAAVEKAKGLFTTNCGNCHKLGELGGGKAPDLTKIGSEHDAAWIEQKVKDPKAHNPGSKMPAFADKMSEDDIKALSAHLAAQK